MTEVNRIELDENTRVIAEYDDWAEKPDWGNESDLPVFAIEYRGNYHADALNTSAEDYERTLTDFVRHYGRDYDLLRRFVRIVYGATTLDWHSTQDADIFIFDPQEVIDAGWKDGATPEDRAGYVKGELSTWSAWANGDVYTIRLEERRTGRKVYGDGSSDERFEEWDIVEQVGGYYGDQEVTDEALEQWARDNTDWPVL